MKETKITAYLLHEHFYQDKKHFYQDKKHFYWVYFFFTCAAIAKSTNVALNPSLTNG